MKRLFVLLCFLLGAVPLAAADFFPYDQVRAGMKGFGRTVFSGSEVERFEVEILGILENIGPRQSLILARLSGGPLEETGVMAGMSGSPVYLEGKLAGAVAYSFPFSTEPIAGIRPIREMIDEFDRRAEAPRRDLRAALVEAAASDPQRERALIERDISLLPASASPLGHEPRLIPIATSIALAGFSERTFAIFGPKLRELGLRPMQGVGGRSRTAASDGDPERPEPGSMVSVALIRGDLDLTAAGTVTHVEGEKIYAFGHRFLSSGPTEMPLLSSSVVAFVPNLSNSFKIAGSGRLLGAITQDRSTGIAGRLGARPQMVPLDVEIDSHGGEGHSYRLELVNDRLLTPFLVQMAVFSAADATEHVLGPASYRVRGAVEFGDSIPPLRLDNMFSGLANVPFELASAAAVPLAYLMHSGFDGPRVNRIHLEVDAFDEERRLEISRIWASEKEVRPGEEIELGAAMRAASREEIVRKTKYRVPVGMAPGPLLVTFSDASSLDVLEWRSFANPRRARDLAQLVRAMNRLRRNDRLYVRIWRPARGFVLATERLPSPPPSIGSVLSSPSASGDEIASEWQSTLTEIELDDFDSVIQGNVTMKLTVSE